jgi:hypothetical protein
MARSKGNKTLDKTDRRKIKTVGITNLDAQPRGKNGSLFRIR